MLGFHNAICVDYNVFEISSSWSGSSTCVVALRMLSFDPIGGLYALFAWLQRRVRRLGKAPQRVGRWVMSILFKPTDWFLTKVNRQKKSDKTSHSDKSYGFFLQLANAPKEFLNTFLVKKLERTTFGKKLSRFMLAAFQISFLNPLKWLTSLAGLLYTWMVTRDWLKVLPRAIPTGLMLASLAVVWLGTRVDKNDLANYYFKLGSEQLSDWQAGIATLAVSRPTPSDNSAKSSHTAETQESKPSVSSYAELLFRRVQLLQNNKHSQFVVGATLIERGAIASGQNRLKSIAPEDRVDYSPAHAIMAASLIRQYHQTSDATLLPRIEHHGLASVSWEFTPKEVLLNITEMLWNRGEHARALGILQVAAQRHPDLNATLASLAEKSGQKRLAQTASQRAIESMQKALKADPRNADMRIKLIQLFEANEQGMANAEVLLLDGLKYGPDIKLTRALSELYRVRFIKQLVAAASVQVNLELLDKAFSFDATNPLLIDQVRMILQGDQNQRQELQDGLNRILTTGKATVATHAILAELWIEQNRPELAKLHLEQIYSAAPHCARYSAALAKLYASGGRLELALQVATDSLNHLEQLKLEKERFVDDLLEVLAEIHWRLGNVDQSIALLERCLTVNPNRAPARKQLIKIYNQKGEVAASEKHQAILRESAKNEASDAKNPEAVVDSQN